jgi:hypothetical protein
MFEVNGAKEINMKLSKILVMSVAITFSLSTSAVIIEGSFSGQIWEFQDTNMEGTIEGKFFADAKASKQFTGTFWYDTDLATKGQQKTDAEGTVSVTYSGPHNWLHTTVTGVNGGILELTSSGGLDTFGEKTYEEVHAEHLPYFGEEAGHDRLLLYYGDDSRIEHKGSYAGLRQGNLYLEPGGVFLNGLELIQNYSTNTDYYGGNTVGYVNFTTQGKLNGVDYFGWMAGEINEFDIHVKTPEPSSLLLFLAPLLLILSRSGLIENPFSRKTNS